MVAEKDANAVRNAAFGVTNIVMFMVLKLYLEFEPIADMQFVVNIPWIKEYGINYYIGVDGFSLTILMLIAILIPCAYLLLWKGRTKGYWVSMLMIQSGVTGTLLSLDLILFYFFWEAMLLPVFLIIGLFGTGNKVFSTIKVTVYTMLGSLLMFVSIMYLGITYFQEFNTWSFSLDALTKITTLTATEKNLLFLGFVIAFAIKIPLFPFHTWILQTYSNSPTGGVFLLSSIMAKLGVYAIVRFMIPLFPDTYIANSKYFVFIGVFGMIYYGIAALMQDDIKKLLAYSSASHLGLIAAGLFALNPYGLTGGMYLIVAHAMATGGLFLLVGILEHRSGTKNISELGGIARRAPIFTVMFMLLLLSNVGLPGTSGFVSELMVIFGIYDFNSSLGVFSAASVVIGASVMLWMFQRAIVQNKSSGGVVKMRDITGRHIWGLVPLIVLIFAMGIYPDFFLAKLEPTMSHYLVDILGIR